jgi:tetratricopeptide (TPR) repeat protein
MNLAPILDQAVKALHEHHYGQVRDILKDVPLSSSKITGVQPRQEQVQLMRCHYIMGEVSVYDKDYKEAAKRLVEANRIAIDMEDFETAWRSRKLAGDALREQSLPGIALEHHSWCSRFLEEGNVPATLDKKLQLAYALALDYHALERYSDAIENYQESIILARETQNTEYLANAYRGLATIYRNQDNLAFTRLYAYQAVGVSETLNDVNAIIRLKGGLARLLAKQGQTEEALFNAQEALKLAEQSASLQNLLTGYVNLSTVNMHANDFDAALDIALKGVDELKQAEADNALVDNVTAGYTVAQVAMVLNKRGREDDRAEARKYLDVAIDYLKQSSHRHALSAMYYSYAQALEKWGNLTEALQYIKKAVALGYATKPPALEF